MLKIEFATDGAAFKSNRNAEVSRIVHELAVKVDYGVTADVILDINGNRIGTFKLTGTGQFCENCGKEFAIKEFEIGRCRKCGTMIEAR